VIGMLYVSARLETSGLAKAARRAKQVALVLVVPVGIMVASRVLGPPVPQVSDTDWGMLFWATLGLGMITSLLMLSGLLYALVLTRKLRRALRVVAQEWWLDTNALPLVEWVSYARLGDGRAEVLFADHRTERFTSKQQARAWLSEHGFVSASRALKKRFVDRGPPAPALPSRRRARPTAADASDPDTA
jgi:hypothetical protein